MESMKFAENVLDIPEDFDVSKLNSLDGGETITMQVEDWIYISLLCDQARALQRYEDPEVVEDFHAKVAAATVEAYNRLANKINYAKEMVDGGLWPKHDEGGK